MKKIFTSVFLLLVAFTCGYSQLIITEIMYNPPESGNDSLEYIELYNASDIPINLSGYQFVNGIEHVFGDVTIFEQGYLVVSKDSSALASVANVSSIQWDSGSLKNDGELLTFADPDGNFVDSLVFAIEVPWPVFVDGAAGAGSSIEFCLETDDNTLGVNWKASTAETGVIINGNEFRGTPGSANSTLCSLPPAQTVIVTSNVFTPADITVNIGDKVLWDNQQGFHNVNGTLETYPDNPEGFGNGGAASAPWMYEFTFTKEGTYQYQCDPHVSLGMVGTITVKNNIPDLVITEIMYNDPSPDEVDSLEFIEIYNAGSEAASLGGITMTTNIINFPFPDTTLASGAFLIVQKNETGFINDPSLLKFSFENGGLSNNSDSVTLTTENGVVIDQVVYMDSGDWPMEADGLGSSISLCDINSDNSIGINWQASSTQTDREYETGSFIFANPGALNNCQITIAEATAIDTNGVAINVGQNVILDGIAHGINLRPNGLQFSLIDDENEGIGVFSSSEQFGYEYAEGDRLRLTGEIVQFNGLTQIRLSDLELIDSDNELVEADTITTLGEDTESSLVTFKDAVILNPSEWTGSGSGFNVSISNGTDTIQLRIDADVADLYGGAYPTGVFTVTGIGSQFDNSEPFTSGYQLLPRYAMDITPYVPFVEQYPLTSIGAVTEVDGNGIALSLDEQVEIIGTTYGINFRPNGLQFTIIDENNDGIGLFAGSNDFDYSYSEGDLISVKGSISQFNGLTQINPDSIRVISSGNELVEPTVVTSLGEETESQFIILESVTILDPTQWAGDGSSFNVDIETSSGAMAIMRIDADSELSDKALPGTTVRVRGIGGQFDNSEPYSEGYQVLPSFEDDVVMISSVDDPILDDHLVSLFPNPVGKVIHLQTDLEIEKVMLFNALGQNVEIERTNPAMIEVSHLNAGTYFVQIFTTEGRIMKSITKL